MLVTVGARYVSEAGLAVLPEMVGSNICVSTNFATAAKTMSRRACSAMAPNRTASFVTTMSVIAL